MSKLTTRISYFSEILFLNFTNYGKVAEYSCFPVAKMNNIGYNICKFFKREDGING